MSPARLPSAALVVFLALLLPRRTYNPTQNGAPPTETDQCPRITSNEASDLSNQIRTMKDKIERLMI